MEAKLSIFQFRILEEKFFSNRNILKSDVNTNFAFKIEGNNFIEDDLKSINSEKIIKNRILQILNKKAKINFHSIENKIFKNNMILVDSDLCNIIAEVLIMYYLSEKSSVAELVNELSKKNPLEYNVTYIQRFYEYKVRSFLYHLVMGMNSTEIWHGEYDASKQFLIKGNNNEIIIYNIYNRNQFEDYLFHNTRLETGSSTRHKFGTIYKDPIDNCFYMKLNLQIRFTSKKNR